MDKALRSTLIVRGIWAILRPIVWYAFFVVVILQYVVFGKYEADPKNPLMYAAAFFILAIPFFAGWHSRALCARAFCGTIERVTVRTRLKSDTFVSKHASNHRIVSDHVYHIRTDSGRRIRYPIREPNFEYAHRFPTGARVVHRFGAPFFDLAEHRCGDDRLCIVCGTLCREEQTVCCECRSPIDRRDTKRRPAWDVER